MGFIDLGGREKELVCSALLLCGWLGGWAEGE